MTEAHQHDFRLPVRIRFRSEEEFNSYFDRELSDHEKAELPSAIIRLCRILNLDPGEFQDVLDQRRGQVVVRSLLSRYAIWKECISQAVSRDTPRLRHLVIYGITKLCLLYWIQDTGLVSEVLREMYQCDGHFSAIYSYILSRYDLDPIIVMRWNLAPSTNGALYSRGLEDYAPIYFIHHAQKARMLFGRRRRRFVDLRLPHPLSMAPVYLAAIHSKPQILLQLLDFGARIQLGGDEREGWNLEMVLRHLVRVLWSALGADLRSVDDLSVDSTVMSNSMRDSLECLRIIVRAVPQIRSEEMDFHLMQFDHQGVLSGSFSSHEFVRLLSETGLVPKFVNRCFEPSDLQHLCRCSVRHSLNEAWNLPFGIEKLPVPSILKRYLALEFD